MDEKKNTQFKMFKLVRTQESVTSWTLKSNFFTNLSI